MRFVDEIDLLLRQHDVRRKLALFTDTARAFDSGLRLLQEEQKEPFSRNASFLLYLETSFKEDIVDLLSSPPQATARDLATLFLEAVLKRDDLNRDEVLRSFTESIRCLPYAWHRSNPIPVGCGPFAALTKGEIDLAELSVPILHTESEFEVKIVACLPAHFGTGETPAHARCLYIQVEAFCTNNAFETAESEISSVVKTLVKTAELILIEETLSRHKSDPIEMFDTSKAENLVIVQGSSLTPYFSFIPACLSDYFAKSPRKDSILRRIRNATRLLVQADAQAENAVGLALSVAAIEALLCRKGDDLANMFAENVAALLEPEPQYRAAAVRWAKKLYSLRSDVFHGSGLECSSSSILSARCLAAAVLSGMVQRREFVHRMGERDETPDDLLRELHDDKYTSGQLTGVDESPITHCWRSEKKQ
jgi:hypothetical protein